MKIKYYRDNRDVDFGDLKVGEYFTLLDVDDTIFMKISDIRVRDLDKDEPCFDEEYNTVCLNDGTLLYIEWLIGVNPFVGNIRVDKE